MSKLLAIFSILLMPTCTWATEPTRILSIGDCITLNIFGGMDRPQGMWYWAHWPGMFYNVEAKGVGSPGSTLYQWGRTEEEKDPNILPVFDLFNFSASPLAPVDILTVRLAVHDGFQGVPLPEFKQAALDILVKARDQLGAEAVVFILRHGKFGFDTGAYDPYFAALEEVCAEEPTAWCTPDVTDLFVAGDNGVTLHPTGQGHEKIADLVAPVLEAVMESLKEGK